MSAETSAELKDWQQYLSKEQKAAIPEGIERGHTPVIESHDGSPFLTHTVCSCGWVGYAEWDNVGLAFDDWIEGHLKRL